MISTNNISTCLTVEEFFIQANWEGKKKETLPLPIISQEETMMAIENREPLSMSLSVGEFFALNNWRGLKEVVSSNSTLQPEVVVTEQLGIMPPLSATVSQFFQRIVWQGQKQVKIAAQPEIQKPQEKITIKDSSPQSLNIQDLSDLF